MSMLSRKPTTLSLLRRYRPLLSDGHLELPRSPPPQERELPRRCSVPMHVLLRPPPLRHFHLPRCQIQFAVPHSAPFRAPQETLRMISRRGFCAVTDTESERENGDGNKRGVDSKEVDRVCQVIDELFALDRSMEAVLDESSIGLSADLVVAVLDRFKHARKPAFRFFCWAGESPGFSHDSRTYNAMMAVLGKARQFETMVSMLEEMGERGMLTTETFVIAIRAFAAAKERKKAAGVFELMKSYGFQVGVGTFNNLLDALGRAKLAKEAQVLFEKLGGTFEPDLQTYTVLINGWCGVKNLVEAGRLWNEMTDRGFVPDVVVHNIMLDGLLRAKKRSDAIKLFTVMKSKGRVRPNLRSFTILIRYLCKQGNMDEAVQYFDSMVESGISPDAAVYTCLITGFGNQRKMDSVYRLLQEMKEKNHPPDSRLYNSLIRLMTSRKMPDDAARVYSRMVRNGIEPTIHTYNMMMKAYFAARNFEMGRAAWDEMARSGFPPDDNSYAIFIGGLVREGSSGEACKYLEEMLAKGMRAPELDYNKLAVDSSRGGRPDLLEEMARKMRAAGKFEVSGVFARWAEMAKRKGLKRSCLNG